MLHDLFIHNLIHDLETLDGLLLCDADISLLQGHRAKTKEKKKSVIRDEDAKSANEKTHVSKIIAHDITFYLPVVEVEESLGRIYTQAGSHILVVGQCSTEAQQTHILLGQLHIADGPRHQRFQHGSTVIVQQVDFILHNTFTVLH